MIEFFMSEELMKSYCQRMMIHYFFIITIGVTMTTRHIDICFVCGGVEPGFLAR